MKNKRLALREVIEVAIGGLTLLTFLAMVIGFTWYSWAHSPVFYKWAAILLMVWGVMWTLIAAVLRTLKKRVHAKWKIVVPLTLSVAGATGAIIGWSSASFCFEEASKWKYGSPGVGGVFFYCLAWISFAMTSYFSIDIALHPDKWTRRKSTPKNN